MIVWINGPFGVGKTAVATALAAHMRATIFDPEKIGFVLHRLPPRSRGDFQDLPRWRRWTIRGLLAASALRPCIVVPMTLVNRDYFDEIVGGLRRRRDVRHFTLLAPHEVIAARLRRRGTTDAWAFERIEPCLEAARAPELVTHLETGALTVDEVVGRVIGHLRR
jgi:hypothetical protein